jgi:hypothetical protein
MNNTIIPGVRIAVLVGIVVLAAALTVHARMVKDKPTEEAARAVANALDGALGGGTNFSMQVASRDSAVIWHDALARDITPPTNRNRDAVMVGDREIAPNERGWVLDVRPVMDRLTSRQDWPDFRDDGKGEIRGFIGKVGMSGGEKVEIGRGLVLRYGKAVDRSLFAAFCSPQRDKFNPLAISLLAQALFHRACDDWEAAASRGKPTGDAAERIQFAQRLHVDAYRDGSPVIPNAAAFVPYPIGYAGRALESEGSETSFMVGPLQGGVGVSVWRRGGDPLRVHQGLAARVLVGTDKSKFCLGTARRIDGAPLTLRIPYTIGAVGGELTVRFDGQKWSIEPDQGGVKDGQWRLPAN